MKPFLPILLALCLLSAPAAAQTLKSLMYNTTNGQVVANTGTNVLTFTNEILVSDSLTTPDLGADNLTVEGAIYFTEAITNVAVTRANLGFSTNLNTLWTATNASNARTAIGLGATNDVAFQSVIFGATDPIFSIDDNGLFLESTNTNTGVAAINFVGAGSEKVAANTRTNLGLGGGITTNITFVDASTNTNSVTISNGIITGWTQ